MRKGKLVELGTMCIVRFDVYGMDDTTHRRYRQVGEVTGVDEPRSGELDSGEYLVTVQFPDGKSFRYFAWRLEEVSTPTPASSLFS